MAGAARRNLAVGRPGFVTAGVARGRRDDAGRLVERRLHAPEAAARKRGDRHPRGGRGGSLGALLGQDWRDAQEKRECAGKNKEKTPHHAASAGWNFIAAPF